MKFLFATLKKNLFQDKGFINEESRLSSIMKGMINPFLVGLGLQIDEYETAPYVYLSN